jgi:hypothetical protein
MEEIKKSLIIKMKQPDGFYQSSTGILGIIGEFGT